MQKVDVYLDDHHVGSAGELAKIIAHNFPVLAVLYSNGSSVVKKYEHGTEDVPHSCDFCKAAIYDTIFKAK